MAWFDQRGNPVATASLAAREAAEMALWRMMSFYDAPLADLDRAIAEDPGWALPHAMKAGFLLSLTDAGLVDEAAAHLAQATQRLPQTGAARERAHVQALQAVLDGRWPQACRIWDEALLSHPRDALALQWAQLWDFYRGDCINLRQRPARALPQWDAVDPLYPHVLALYAFGLEECNLYPEAEEAGRQALELQPRAPWAIHAVAHVMEMQGRFDDGAAWLRQHQPAWSEGNGFHCHLWWHLGLFRLEGLDTAGVLRLLDSRLSGALLEVVLQRLDAASLLWRLHLLGTDIHSRSAELLAGWNADASHAGHYSFNDVHVLLAMLGAGELARAEGWLARCAERVLSATDAPRANQGQAREVGLPLMRALLAFVRGDADTATAALYAVRGQSQRLGGSQAQRDLIDQTLLAAAAAGSTPARRMGQAVLNERRMAKPLTPLTRHWAQALEASDGDRA